MRVVFAGTPVFAQQALSAILDAGHEIVGVLTQPDRPSGRGMKLQASPVKLAALDAGIPIQQPRSLRLGGKFADEAQAAQAALVSWAPDVMVVAAYGLILPQWVLDLPRYGCLNIHASLLPRWRGAAPIQRAIQAGDAASGITIMQMDAGLDTGAMLLRVERPIQSDTTGAGLHDALAADGAQAIVAVLRDLEAGTPPTPIPQPQEGITYADKLQKSESVLDFSLSAAVLVRRIHAFDPFPGSVMPLPGFELPVKIWAAQALPATDTSAPPGTIMHMGRDGIDIATADGVLRITALQRPGGRRQSVDVFMQSYQTS